MNFNKDNKIKDNFIVKVNYNNNIYDVETEKSLNLFQLKQKIFNIFSLKSNSYSLSYNGIKLSKEYNPVPLFIIFKSNNSPLLFINDSKTILPTAKPNNSIFISTKITNRKLLELINDYFEYKLLKYNIRVTQPIKNLYKITFQNPSIASDFKKFFELNKNNKKYNSAPPPILIKKNLSDIFCTKSLIKNDRTKALFNVISYNVQSDYISQNKIKMGIDKYHRSYFKKKNNILKKNVDINKKGYQGMYSFPYMSEEEKYLREKYLDKQKWIDKKGFIVSVGNYKMKQSNFYEPKNLKDFTYKLKIHNNFMSRNPEKTNNLKKIKNLSV